MVNPACFLTGNGPEFGTFGRIRQLFFFSSSIFTSIGFYKTILLKYSEYSYSETSQFQVSVTLNQVSPFSQVPYLKKTIKVNLFLSQGVVVFD